MTSRFTSNLVLLLGGAFLVSASLAFSASVIGWLALANGALILLTILSAFALRGRGVAQRVLDAFGFATAVWTVVASRCFAGADLRWLTFANGALMALLAFTGLIVHEVLMELALSRRIEQTPDGRVSSGEREHASLGIVG